MAEFVGEKRFQIVRAGALSGANAAGVAKVTSPVLQKSVSASRIWPANAAGPLAPTLTPGAFAINVRVKASTPGVNAALDWLKQIVFKSIDVAARVVGAGIRIASRAPKELPVPETRLS